MKTKTNGNLFVYGSLRDKALFRSVCGYDFACTRARMDRNTLFAESGFVLGYTTVSPDGLYPYAVARPGGRIDGLLIHTVPNTAIALIDRYEGRYYRRERVVLKTAAGAVSEAQAYLADEALIHKDFGDQFDTPG